MACLYDDPCILIGGAPRSGTTLLGMILSRHPQGAILLEERLTNVVLAVERLCSIRADVDESERATIFGGPRSFLPYPLWEHESDLEKLSRLDTYASRFNRLFKETFAVATGKRDLIAVGSKLPITDTWEDVSLLRDRLRDLRLIFIVRNPLDVISSSMVRAINARRGLDEWPIRDVAAAYEQWLSAMRHMHDVVRASPAGGVLLIKYEDLCAFPAREERRVRAFASLPMKGASVVACNPSGDRSGLSTEDLAFLERELGDVDQVWPTLTAEQALQGYARPVRHLPLGDTSFASGAYAEVLVSGFSQAEPWGRWTDGPLAILQFRHPGPSRLRLGLDVAMAHIPSGRDGAPLKIRVNGGATKLASAKPGVRLDIDLTPTDLVADVLTIEIVVLEPKPQDAAPLDDQRMLGLALTGVSLSPVSAVRPAIAPPKPVSGLFKAFAFGRPRARFGGSCADPEAKGLKNGLRT